MSDAHGGGKPGLPLMGLAQGIAHKMHSSGYHVRTRPLVIIFVVANLAFLILSPLQTLRNWEFVAFFAPVWIPYTIIYFTWQQWVRARRAEFLTNQEYVLLELRMPRDTKKTPLSMETIFSNLHITSGESTDYAKYWQGKVRTWFSLEIVSLGGRVHFYIWTRAGLRRGVESFFYAQYPDMEIVEAEDYSLVYDPSAHENDMFGEEFIHTKEDAYPIKTYIDFGLDKTGAEPEEITDPLAQMLELFGSVGPKEQLWLQLVIRATKSEKFEDQAKKDYTWKDQGQEVITSLREKSVKQAKVLSNEDEIPFPTNLTPGQTDTIKAIERNISKQGFDVGMRAMYTAPKEAYQGTMITFMLGTMLKPFASDSLNGFKPASTFDAMFNDYPWEDPGGHHRQHLHHQFVDAYRRRSFFHAPYVGQWMVMSTEELATIFHIPSAAIETPSLPRLQSATSGAPANLPT